MMKEKWQESWYFALSPGGGPAALSCAETLRQNGFTGRIVMVMKEKRLPYDRVTLSKNLAVNADSLALRDKAFFQVLQ